MPSQLATHTHDIVTPDPASSATRHRCLPGARTAARVLLLLALPASIAITPDAVEAQARRGRSQVEQTPFAPAKVAARFGYNQNPTGEVLGIGAMLPLIRSGRIEFAPSIDWVFVRGNRDRQLQLDALYVHGQRQGALFGGFGVAWRDLQNPSPGVPQGTQRGYAFVAGLRSGAGGLLQTQAEIRWTLLPDNGTNPASVTIGLVLPLWRNPPQG